MRYGRHPWCAYCLRRYAAVIRMALWPSYDPT